MLRTYGKSLGALLVALLTALAAAVSDSHIQTAEAIQVAIAVTTAAGVYLVPDLPQWPWAKTAVAVLLAGLNFATTILTDGITAAEWINLALAMLGVVVVVKAPSEPTGRAASMPPRPVRF